MNEISIIVIASACGISAKCILTNPISLTSTRLEAAGAGNKKYKNMFDAFRAIHKEEKLTGFTKGLKPLLFKEAPNHVLFYSLYQYTNKWLNDKQIFSNQFNNCLSVISSSIIPPILDNHFDLIRTRSQYQFISKNKDHLYPSIHRALIHIYTKEGIKGLQKGVLPRIIGRYYLQKCYGQYTKPSITKRNNINQLYSIQVNKLIT